MIVTAWKNGKFMNPGTDYGVRVTMADRKCLFDPQWTTIRLQLEGEPGKFEVNVGKKSFWTPGCGELIDKRIGQWLFKNKLAPWQKGDPPELELEQRKNNHFYLLNLTHDQSKIQINILFYLYCFH